MGMGVPGVGGAFAGAAAAPEPGGGRVKPWPNLRALLKMHAGMGSSRLAGLCLVGLWTAAPLSASNILLVGKE